MTYKEITFAQVQKAVANYNGDLVYIGRYTNRNDIKFYLLRTTEMKTHDYGREKFVNFVAWPRSYYATETESPRLAMTFGVDSLSLWMFKNDETAAEYLAKYGYVEFTRWLNEIDEPKTTEETLIINAHTTENTPLFDNEQMIVPRNPEDEDRLLNRALETILNAFHTNKGRGSISKEVLMDQCFVPDDIYNYAFSLLDTKGYLAKEIGGLTLEGLSYMKNRDSKELRVNIHSRTVFVAQAFNDELNGVFDDYYSPTVGSLRLNPVRIDETDHDQPVDVEILNQIRQCRFMICDLTYSRPSVYFEAGYALARGIRVFFTAKYDHNSDDPGFDASKNKIHFDLRNRHITWWNPSNYEGFKTELSTRIQRYLEWQKE